MSLVILFCTRDLFLSIWSDLSSWQWNATKTSRMSKVTSDPWICPVLPYYYVIFSYQARFYADYAVFSKAVLNAACEYVFPAVRTAKPFFYNGIMQLPNVRLYVFRCNCTVRGFLQWNRNWQNAHCTSVQLPWKQCRPWETEGIVYMKGNLNRATVRH